MNCEKFDLDPVYSRLLNASQIHTRKMPLSVIEPICAYGTVGNSHLYSKYQLAKINNLRGMFVDMRYKEARTSYALAGVRKTQNNRKRIYYHLMFSRMFCYRRFVCSVARRSEGRQCQQSAFDAFVLIMFVGSHKSLTHKHKYTQREQKTGHSITVVLCKQLP